MSQGTITVSINELRVGVTCSHPIEDDSGVLLLGAGTPITHQVVDGLRDRGIHYIDVDPRDLAAMRGRRKKAAPSRRETVSESIYAPAFPFKRNMVDRHDEGFSVARERQLKQQLEQAKICYTELKIRLSHEKLRSVVGLSDVSDGYARSILADHDQTIGMVGNLDDDDHDIQSIQLAVLGMAVATEMELDGPQVLEVGLTALLHDIGLLAMDRRFLQPVETMSDEERWEYRKHPLVSAMCISDAVEVPRSIQLAIQQVHEQFDGSGYPRGLKGPRIHLYARILNVVDAYLNLISPTPLRHAVVPHDALGLMLHQASRGFFDPSVIKALLNVQCLFPLGSMVELSNGQQAKVIRRPRNGFAEPVLVGVDGKRIDLEISDVHVVRPVCASDTRQIRLTPEMMRSAAWHPAQHVMPT